MTVVTLWFASDRIVESPCPSESEDPAGFSTRQYVLRELGAMLRVYDASDPAGRTALQALVTDTLTGTTTSLDALKVPEEFDLRN